jgi:urea transport system substrate-binding protein
MTADSVLVDPLAALVRGPADHALRVCLAVPMSGALGLTGSCALACAVLAAEEINAAGGRRGRRLELVLLDAGRTPDTVAAELLRLVDAHVIDAVCGYHTSDVHRRLETVTAGRLPYVFTPPHEGGTRREGVVLLGESPHEQLLPVMAQLASRPSLRRWALVGNDYIWPWAVHAAAGSMLRATGAEVVLHELVPFGAVDGERLIERLLRAKAQAVLLSLVGRDLATFNRMFRQAGLDGRGRRQRRAVRGDAVVRLRARLRRARGAVHPALGPIRAVAGRVRAGLLLGHPFPGRARCSAGPGAPGARRRAHVDRGGLITNQSRATLILPGGRSFS